MIEAVCLFVFTTDAIVTNATSTSAYTVTRSTAAGSISFTVKFVRLKRHSRYFKKPAKVFVSFWSKIFDRNKSKSKPASEEGTKHALWIDSLHVSKVYETSIKGVYPAVAV